MDVLLLRKVLSALMITNSKLLCVLFCSCWTALFLYSMYIRLIFVYKHDAYIEIYVDLADSICGFLLNIIITVNMGWINVGVFDEIIKKLIETEKILGKPQKSWFYFEFALVVCLVIGIVTWCLLYFFKMEFLIHMSFVVDYIGKARAIYVVFVIFTHVKVIKDKLRTLEIMLKERVKYLNIQSNEIVSSRSNSWISSDIQNMAKIFTLLSEVTENLNKLFGWTILMYSSSSISSILVLINFSFELEQKSSLHFNDFIIISFVYTTLTLLYEALLTKHCDDLIKASEKVGSTSLKLLETLDLTKYPLYNTAKENLLLLAEQSRSSTLKISAAGFFDVEFRSLFVLMEISMSQTLMFIQLKL